MKRNFILFIITNFLFFSYLDSYLFAEEETTITSLFREQADSIVLIGTVGNKGSKLGSGFIVNSDGLIVTNCHLISDTKKIFVKLKNKKAYNRIHVVATDGEKDIAIIKINTKGLPAVKLGNSKNIQIGQRVVAISNPLGLENTVSDGLISSVRHVKSGFDVLQISVPLSNGSSGGPLFNLEGEVIGIVTASLSSGQSLNFAVPINYVKPLLRNFHYRDETGKSLKKEKNFTLYIVQPNDTLYSLARRFNTTVKEIMVLNKFTSSNIKRDWQIKIPVSQ